MSEAFLTGSIGSYFYANAAIDGITLHISEAAASDDRDGLSRGKDVVDIPADPKVMEL